MNFVALAVYGFGHFGKSLLWTSSVLIFAFYLTEIAGLAPATMGWVLAVSLLVNAGSDWLVGRVAGRFVTNVKAATNLQFAGALIAGFCFVLFAHTAAVEVESRVLYALVTLIAFRLGYSLYDVPQNAVLALVVDNDAERSQISAVRYAAAGLANIVVTLCLSYWIISVSNVDRGSAFAAFALVFAATAVTSSLAVTLYFARWELQATGRPRHSVANTANTPKRLSPVLAFGAIIAFSSLVPVFTKLKVYYAAYAFPPDSNAVTFLLAAALGQVIAQPLWARGGHLLSLEKLYSLAAIAVISSGVAFGLAAFGTEFWVLAAVFFFGASSSGLLMAIWAIMGNVAAADPERALSSFGNFTLCSKLAQAVSILIVGQVLELSAYREGLIAIVIATMSGSVIVTGCLCLLLAVVVRSLAAPRFARGHESRSRYQSGE